MSRQVIRPAKRLLGEILVPGDKSISHRALLVAGVGEGLCSISGLSSSEDVAATTAALASLGVVISNHNPEVERRKQSTRGLDSQILVEGTGWQGLRESARSIFCQNSGTTARTLAGVLAGRPFATTLEGDHSLSSRPMRRVIDPLTKMGASIKATDDRLPMTIVGGGLQGIDFESPVASAQVKTAVLLAGLQASGTTSVGEPTLSRDHTERLLEYLGVFIEKTPDRLIVKSTNIRNASSLNVPGDLSSAAFLLVAAALLPGSDVTIRSLGLNPTRSGILDVLRAFGAEVAVSEERVACGEPVGTVTVRSGDRKPLYVGGELVPRTIDELPLVAVLGAFGEGTTRIADAAELRVKESDRIAAMAEGLAALGATVDTAPDGMTIRGGSGLRGGDVSSRGDHRIAMALAVAGSAAQGDTAIEGWEAVGVSYPEFLRDLKLLIET